MNQELVQYQEQRALTAADMRAHVNRVQEVMKAVMQGPSKDNPAGVHYGTIPGTPKPTLYKAGAEVLAATFRIAVSYQVEELSTLDIVRYRVTAIGTHQTSGIVMGAGMGECSSGEEKYKWRKASTKKEFDATSEDKRRLKYGYDKMKREEYEIRQVRTEPADLANTVLKMACKRAQVAMILNVTAASDIFTQDIEDLPEELQPHEDAQPKPSVAQPQRKSDQRGAPEDSHMSAQAGRAEAPIGNQHEVPAQTALHPKTSAAQENGLNGADAIPKSEPASAAGPDIDLDGPVLQPQQVKILLKRMESAALTDLDIKAKFGKPLGALKAAQFNAIADYLKNPAG